MAEWRLTSAALGWGCTAWRDFPRLHENLHPLLAREIRVWNSWNSALVKGRFTPFPVVSCSIIPFRRYRWSTCKRTSIRRNYVFDIIDKDPKSCLLIVERQFQQSVFVEVREEERKLLQWMNFQRSTVSNTNLHSLYIVFVFVTGSYLAELLEDVFVVEVFVSSFRFHAAVWIVMAAVILFTTKTTGCWLILLLNF